VFWILGYNTIMVKYKEIILILIMLFFLSFSFYPTLFELGKAKVLKDTLREFILEHNYYWPDYNLYLSKVRQGYEGHLTAVERYTGEVHTGSLIQVFYVFLGHLGAMFHLDPNFSYLLGRIIFSPLLILVIIFFVTFFFRSFIWQILGLFIILTSGSFPRIYTDSQGSHIGRFMEWWSNIDALQRITFIPHILFGQVVSFYLLSRLTMNKKQITNHQLLYYILLGNAVGLVFPPSLITLNGIIVINMILLMVKNTKSVCQQMRLKILNFDLSFCTFHFTFCILTLPSLIYLFITTRYVPWSSLVEYHRSHPMIIPFWEYISATGPVFFLGLLGGILSIFRRDRKYQPLIFWLIATFAFAVLFTHVKEQSPLRFTQTGLFIPLGILGTYFFREIYEFLKGLAFNNQIKKFIVICYLLSVICYIGGSLYIMRVSLLWQTDFITQRANASLPTVPYPPQTMYPLVEWMDAIRWLKDNTKREEVVLAEITAGNYIPAYSGNTVYFGQSNTVDYEKKQILVDKFFKGEMTKKDATDFLDQGRITYIFVSFQEREMLGDKKIEEIYPFLKQVYSNPSVSILKYR